jgi:hypothetical protein
MSPSTTGRHVGASAPLLPTLFLLLSCTSAPPPVPSPTTSSPNPARVTPGLDMYASSPCALLNEKDLADFQDVTLGPSHSFRSMVVRTEPDAPSDTCTVGTSFTNLVISKFQQVS